MARDYAEHCPVSPTKNKLLVIAAILLMSQVVLCQRVRVEAEVEAYPTESVDLRCQFVDGGGTKLTQVSWIWEPTEGQRDNIAVFHPTYGQSFPDSPFSSRVAFIQGTLENPSIRISRLKMADEGRYTCEYATYPTGNEQGTTSLLMLAKPKNSASAVPAQAGTKPAVVAQCQAADGKPAASIKWMTLLGGNHTTTSKTGEDGTVTVRSEYRMVPTAADNAKDLTCIVSQRTQERPQSFAMKLSVEYPPTVSIEGYDSNWYIGRLDASLVCLAKANPAPTTVTWTAMSGPMPDTVQVEGNRLLVRKVDLAVNTTFVCEVKNRLGVSKQQVTTLVIEKRVKTPGPNTGAIIGGIIAVILLAAIIAAVVLMVRKRQQNAENGDGPPKHKPPPPVKAGSSTEMLTKPVDSVTETQPLSNKTYYETGGEPVTDLDADDDDNDNTGGGAAANGGAPSDLEDTVIYDNVDESQKDSLPPYSATPEVEGNHGDEVNLEPPSTTVSRGESFVSSAMYV